MKSPSEIFPEPDRLTEEPPADRYCDIVLTGGVASGVVYPWAIVELARHYRFKSIGGSSVGAIAASLTAASEYSRRLNNPYPFEVLRQVPIELAKEDEQTGDSKMLRLFQANSRGTRPLGIFVTVLKKLNSKRKRQEEKQNSFSLDRLGSLSTVTSIGSVIRKYYWRDVTKRVVLSRWFLFIFLLLVFAILAPNCADKNNTCVYGVTNFFVWFIGLACGFGLLALIAKEFIATVLEDIDEGINQNLFGLCSGISTDPASTNREQGFTDWLHEGIQRAAGLKIYGPPLTFSDLWNAPEFPGDKAIQSDRAPDDIVPPNKRAIDLQMFASNLSVGAPIRLPSVDEEARLYFDPDELVSLFPASVIQHLRDVAKPYKPRTLSDPQSRDAVLANGERRTIIGLCELPVAQLPVVVAARMSMCFPVLFSAIPLYAVDYNAPRDERVFRRTWISDGGICSNFPIQFFDSPIPAWPTFGMYLDQRIDAYKNGAVNLPVSHLNGRSKIWQYFLPDLQNASAVDKNNGFRFQAVKNILGLLTGVVSTAKDWADREQLISPQTRNRVVRMALKEGEGQLNIAMDNATILRMAHVYGTGGGKRLVERFAPVNGEPTQAWREHLYVRTNVLADTLARFLDSFTESSLSSAHSVPIRELLEFAVANPWIKVLSKSNSMTEDEGIASRSLYPLNLDQTEKLLEIIESLQTLETKFTELRNSGVPYVARPEVGLRMRPESS